MLEIACPAAPATVPPPASTPGTRARRVRIPRDRAIVLVCERGAGLSLADHSLVKSVYLEGRTPMDLARRLRCSHHAVRLRVRRLIHRLASRRYQFVLRNHPAWSHARREVAAACFLRGLSVRQAAEELKLTQHAVRRHRAAVEALCDGAAA
ncbi:hypothetical protein PHYC_01766 [Phycisphaerales bacterium]|nr:hypothetical protein PHYC_01766 [Phycisphaerales bacterium]